jgi:CheY-like chemotaxis protein
MRCAKSFLVVARNLDVQDLYVLNLRAQRVSVLNVNTCEEAVRASRLAPFDAVLLDLESREDWESLATFRKDLSREVPIVVLSEWLAVDRSYRNLARHRGCAGFVAKPAGATLVAHALRRASQGSPWSEYVDAHA